MTNPHPITTVIVNNVDVDKAATISYVKTRTRVAVVNVSEARNTDFSGQSGGIDIGGVLYNLDPTDTTSPDDGSSVIIDAAGNRFKVLIQNASAGNVIPCSVSGTTNAIVFTPIFQSVSALVDGMMFSGIPAGTVDAAIPTLTITGVAGAKGIRLSDGYGFPIFQEIQKDKPLIVRWSAALGVFTIQNQQQGSFAGSSFSHGTGKLQTSSSTSLFFTQEDGRGMLIWNPLTSSFRLINNPTVSASNIFAAQNYVGGVANQGCASNQLYSVYLFNPTGTNDQDIQFDFWPTFLGVGVLGWNPTLNNLGMYVKPTAAGGSSPDNTRTYVGMLYTAGFDISSVLTGPVTIQRVQSHHKLWRFPVITDMVSTAVTTASNVLSSPRCETISEGITDCPFYTVHANYKNTSPGAVGTLQLQFTHVAFNGTTTVSLSPHICRATAQAAGDWTPMSLSWGFANAMAHIECRPVIGVNAGTGTFEVYIQEHTAW